MSGKLTFWHGPMRSGKSLAVVSMAKRLHASGRPGQVVTMGDRSGADKVTSRGGHEVDAVAMMPGSLWSPVQVLQRRGIWPLEWLVIDEAQFMSPHDVDDVARRLDCDDLVEVHALGLLTNDRGELFSGAQRLVELADAVNVIGSAVQCDHECGREARYQLRVKDGKWFPIPYGETAIGDDYALLCRKCMMQTKTGRIHR